MLRSWVLALQDSPEEQVAWDAIVRGQDVSVWCSGRAKSMKNIETPPYFES